MLHSRLVGYPDCESEKKDRLNESFGPQRITVGGFVGFCLDGNVSRQTLSLSECVVVPPSRLHFHRVGYPD